MLHNRLGTASFFALAAVATCAGVRETRAAYIASFLVNETGSTFQFANNGASSTFDTVDPTTSSTTIPVTFYYRVPNVYGPVDAGIPATLTLTSSVSSIASSYGGIDYQAMKSVSIAFVANTAVMVNSVAERNVLTATGTALLSNTNNSADVNFTADTSVGNTVMFTSDFLGLQGGAASYAFSLSSVSPVLHIDTNHYLRGFTGAGSGDFVSTIDSVPEPATSGLLALGGMFLLGRRRRK